MPEDNTNQPGAKRGVFSRLTSSLRRSTGGVSPAPPTTPPPAAPTGGVSPAPPAGHSGSSANGDGSLKISHNDYTKVAQDHAAAHTAGATVVSDDHQIKTVDQQMAGMTNKGTVFSPKWNSDASKLESLASNASHEKTVQGVDNQSANAVVDHDLAHAAGATYASDESKLKSLSSQAAKDQKAGDFFGGDGKNAGVVGLSNQMQSLETKATAAQASQKAANQAAAFDTDHVKAFQAGETVVAKTSSYEKEAALADTATAKAHGNFFGPGKTVDTRATAAAVADLNKADAAKAAQTADNAAAAAVYKAPTTPLTNTTASAPSSPLAHTTLASAPPTTPPPAVTTPLAIPPAAPTAATPPPPTAAPAQTSSYSAFKPPASPVTTAQTDPTKGLGDSRAAQPPPDPATKIVISDSSQGTKGSTDPTHVRRIK